MPSPAKLSTKAILIAVSLTFVGCGGVKETPGSATEENPQGRRNSTDRLIDPAEILQRTFDRYRNAKTYQDAAELVATTSLGGRVSSRAVAPLSVWLDEDLLFVAAYESRIWSDGRRMNAWMVSPETDHFDSQVLSVQVDPGRPAAEKLIIDPVLIDAIGGGAGGPPPQLDWLFSADPMSGLFERRPRMVSTGRVSVDDFLCEVFIVIDGGDEFVFYIDRKRSLVRRIDLPSPEQNVDGSQTELTLYLRGATFDQSAELPRIDTVPSPPKYVSRWVPLPAAKPLRDVSESVSRNIFSKLTSEVIWVTNTRSEKTLRWMNELKAMYADSHDEKIQILIEETPGVSAKDIQTIDSKFFPRMPDESLCLVSRDGTIHFHQDLIPPVDPAALMAATSDLEAGFDVRKRLLNQWHRANETYRQELSKAIID